MDRIPRPNPTLPRVTAGGVARPSVPPPGTWFLGRYRIVDTLGAGGMATVHLARVDGVGGFQKWVAIKRIHTDLTEDEQLVRMFLDEARIAASISHPNVAQVFELGEHKGTYWIAMEYLHGEPVREIMRVQEEKGERMAPELAARIIADAAEGLHAAHELRSKDGDLLNLVHRDVTPHNLFVTYDGTVKVVDFGIAKVTGRLSSTVAGTLKGKIAYMSPEQILGRDLDRRSDIFSLAVVLWELSTGRRLFRADTDSETLGRVRACIVPPPSIVVPSYPAELEAIVMRALSKDPKARQETAREMSRSLQQYLIHAKAFVGSEEIASHMTKLFSDRLPQREEHLRWAAEVTNTVSIEQPSPVAATVQVRDSATTVPDEPPRTLREPRVAPKVVEVTGSTTERMPRRQDPLMQTLREPALRALRATVPDPLAAATEPMLRAEPATLKDRPVQFAEHEPAATRPKTAPEAAKPRLQPSPPPDPEAEDDGDTVVVSEAEMLAAMRQEAERGGGEDDDDEAPTMALVPDRVPMAARRAMAAPDLPQDSVNQVPPPAPLGEASASVSVPTLPDLRSARADPAPVDPAALVAQTLAEMGKASPAEMGAPTPAVPLAPQPEAVAAPAHPMAASGSRIIDVAPPCDEPVSQDYEAGLYARQRSRRVVLIAGLLGGLFVLLGAALLFWALSRN